MSLKGHTIQLYSLWWKPKIHSHAWLSREIESCSLINMNKNVQTSDGHNAERIKTRYETSVIGRKVRKKGRNMIFSQIDKVCLF